MNSREFTPQPKSGGAVPRIPVVSANAVRDAERPDRTIEETRAGIRVGRAIARLQLALDD